MCMISDKRKTSIRLMKMGDQIKIGDIVQTTV